MTDTNLTVVPDTDTELESFKQRIKDERTRFDHLAAWHMELYLATGTELPYNGDNTYITFNAGEYGKDAEGNRDYSNYIQDNDKNVAALAKVAKYASKQRDIKVDKDYSTHDFELKITLPTGEIVRYMVNREAVCEKRVVGQRVIPAKHTPERVEDIVEWECAKVSLLGLDNDE